MLTKDKMTMDEMSVDQMTLGAMTHSQLAINLFFITSIFKHLFSYLTSVCGAMTIRIMTFSITTSGITRQKCDTPHNDT